MTALSHRTTCTKMDDRLSFVNETESTASPNLRNKFPVKISDSYCLMISSCFFLIPGGYAFAAGYPFYGVVSTVTTMVSANYWRNAIEGWRRTVDLITAKVSFGIYFISGLIYMRDWRFFAVGIPAVVGIGIFYHLSGKYWNLDSPSWVYFHMLFHLFVALEQALVVCSIVYSYATEKEFFFAK